MSFPSTNGCCHLTLLKCNHLLTAIQHGHVSKFKKLNSAFITLLPKQVDACRVKDFRSISLIHSFAMLVSKILANRLAPLLPSMVSLIKVLLSKGEVSMIIFSLCSKWPSVCMQEKNHMFC